MGAGGCGSDRGHGPDEAAARLYLGGLGEIFVVDVESERAERIDFPALVGGDPSNLIEGRGDGFVMWSGDRTLFSRFDLTERPRSIGESLFFVPGAEPDGVWLVGRQPSGAEGLGPTREVDTTGETIVPATGRPPIGYPAAAVPAGLVFRSPERGMAIWDPSTDEIVERISIGSGLIGATRGETISLCDYEDGAKLRIAMTSSRKVLPVSTPGKVEGVDCRNGEISPGGTLLAAPVVISDHRLGWREYSEAPVALGVADLTTRRLTIIPGTRVPNDYHCALEPRWRRGVHPRPRVRRSAEGRSQESHRRVLGVGGRGARRRRGPGRVLRRRRRRGKWSAPEELLRDAPVCRWWLAGVAWGWWLTERASPWWPGAPRRGGRVRAAQGQVDPWRCSAEHRQRIPASGFSH